MGSEVCPRQWAGRKKDGDKGLMMEEVVAVVEERGGVAIDAGTRASKSRKEEAQCSNSNLSDRDTAIISD